jgi:hypothetical protein
MDGSEPIRRDAARRLEERRVARSRPAARGTLACPACDAPVAPAVDPVSPADPLDCPFCRHAGPVRDFLSLAGPPRPARVDLHVVRRNAT